MVQKARKEESVEQYLKETNYWNIDKVQSLRSSNKVAWSLAVFGLGLATVCAWSVGQLAPLKTVEPYVIRVNETSGTVDIVTGITNGKTTYEEALNKYFIGKYIRYREGYSRTFAEEYYYNTGLMSGKEETIRYLAWFNPKNPMSPLNIYTTEDKVNIKIQSTSFIGEKRDIALVRYIKEVESGNSLKPVITHWAATLKFQYSAAPTKERDREITPLGFQVTEYRNDPDSAGQNSNDTPSITYKEAKQKSITANTGGIAPYERMPTNEE